MRSITVAVSFAAMLLSLVATAAEPKKPTAVFGTKPGDRWVEKHLAKDLIGRVKLAAAIDEKVAVLYTEKTALRLGFLRNRPLQRLDCRRGRYPHRHRRHHLRLRPGDGGGRSTIRLQAGSPA